MALDLTTTNVLLGIMAAVNLLEAVAIMVVIGGAFLVYRRVLQVVNRIEERQVAPAAARVNAILDDVKGVTSTVRQETGRLDGLLDWILDSFGHKHRRTHEQPPRVM
jgi:hypothetical protein